MKTLSQLRVLALIIFLSSCAKIFQTPDAEYLAQIQDVVAVLPPSVSIQARMFVDAESMKEQQRTESMNIKRKCTLGYYAGRCKERFSKKFLI